MSAEDGSADGADRGSGRGVGADRPGVAPLRGDRTAEPGDTDSSGTPVVRQRRRGTGLPHQPAPSPRVVPRPDRAGARRPRLGPRHLPDRPRRRPGRRPTSTSVRSSAPPPPTPGPTNRARSAARATARRRYGPSPSSAGCRSRPSWSPWWSVHIGRDDAVQSFEAYGSGPTDRLDRAGMLSPRTTIMHAGVVTDDDIARFAPAGVTVNHNPVGNALYGFGVAAARSVPRLLDAGVPIVLGSDWTPAVTSPFETIRMVLALHRDVAANDLALSLEAALTMATRSDTVLGRPGGLGRIAPGQLADIVVIDLSGPHHLASNHPVPATALHARAGDVTTVVVDGRVVVDHGQLTTIDEGVLVTEARRALASL